MRRRQPDPAEFSHEAPPQELLRFRPAAPSPIGPHGRPEPWRVEWTAGEFAAWLRARAAWRNNHTRELPGLPARERYALHRIAGLPSALVAEETEHSKAARPPKYEHTARRHRPASPVAWSHLEPEEGTTRA